MRKKKRRVRVPLNQKRHRFVVTVTMPLTMSRTKAMAYFRLFLARRWGGKCWVSDGSTKNSVAHK